MHKRFLILLILQIAFLLTHAQSFNEYFEDATLRIDYIFAGNKTHQAIYLDELKQLPKWNGRMVNLDTLAIVGNGNITVRNHKNGNIIYRQAFSTLFQEWLSYDEAEVQSRSFENVFLIPFPKDTVDITVSLFDNRLQTMCELTHMVAPKDILIHKMGYSNVTPYDVIQEANASENCVRIAYLAEGFTEASMPHFIEKANEANEALFSHEPFKSMRDRFEVVAVKAVSKEEGTSTPSEGDWRNTVLSSHFDTFYSNRYLTTLNIKDMHDQLAGTPYDHIIVLVNTEHYGGGGIFNSYNLTMTDNPKFKPVVVHEFGHSFAGLADEYAYEEEDVPVYPLDVEPWEKNITTLTDFSKKWKSMADSKEHEGVGLYEGAGYSLKGVYRPCKDCRMRTNENPKFCPVCERAIKDIIDFYTITLKK